MRDNNRDRRYRRFVKEYINNGFNASDAYSKAYKIKKSPETAQCGHRLLININCVKILCEELRKMGVDDYIGKEYIVDKAIDLLTTAKQESTRARVLELLSKVGGLTKEQQSTINVYSNLDSKKDDILLKRKELGIVE